MNQSLKTRVAALEAMPPLDELAPCPDGLVRRPGARNFFIPVPIDPCTWAEMARTQQAKLLATEATDRAAREGGTP